MSIIGFSKDLYFYSRCVTIGGKFHFLVSLFQVCVAIKQASKDQSNECCPSSRGKTGRHSGSVWFAAIADLGFASLTGVSAQLLRQIAISRQTRFMHISQLCLLNSTDLFKLNICLVRDFLASVKQIKKADGIVFLIYVCHSSQPLCPICLAAWARASSWWRVPLSSCSRGAAIKARKLILITNMQVRTTKHNNAKSTPFYPHHFTCLEIK